MDYYFAEVSLWICSACGQKWVRYFYELEAFTASGRWYLGAIHPEQGSFLTADNAARNPGKPGLVFLWGKLLLLLTDPRQPSVNQSALNCLQRIEFFRGKIRDLPHDPHQVAIVLG